MKPILGVRPGLAALFLFCCATSTAGAQCADYASSLHWMGQVDTPDSYQAHVAVSGRYGFVSGPILRVVDVTDPASPHIVGELAISTKDVAISGDHAYAACYTSGFRVIDISDPLTPTLVGSVDTPGEAYRVVVSGGYAYVADWSSGLQVIDISDPTLPRIVGSLDTNWARDVAVQEPYAYVANASQGMKVIDVSDPGSPRLVGSFATNYYSNSVDVAGDYAYLGDHSHLRVIDVSDPSSPVVVGSVATGDWDIALEGRYAFTAGGSLQAVDISDPTDPRVVGSAQVSSSVGLAVANGTAYVAVDSYHVDNFQIFDVRNPVSPQMIGVWDTPGDALGVTVSENLAYVADELYGLQIIDISDPSFPSRIARVNTPGVASQVAVAGRHAIVCDGPQGVQVIDVGFASPPYIAGSVAMPAEPRDVVAIAGYAYVTARSYGVQIVDYSDPSSPVIVGTISTAGWAGGITRAGALLFVGDGFEIQILDISDPAHPLVIGAVEMGARSLAFSDDRLYVLEDDIVQVIDVSDPMFPRTLGRLDQVPEYTYSIAAAGDCAYITGESVGGLWVIDASDPWNPYVRGSIETPGRTMDVTLAGELVCIGASQSGLEIVPAQCGLTSSVDGRGVRQASMLRAQPNPCHGEAEIVFATTAEPTGHVDVYDAAGRLLRRLAGGPMAAGTQRLAWNGEDERGYQVGAGVYWIRLSTSRGAKSIPLVLLP